MAAKTRRGAAPEYVSGTAARKLEPERRQERPREPRREASSQSRTVTVRRNQEKALQMDLPYVIVLTIAAVCTLYFCVSYLQLQSSIAARLNHIEALEASIDLDNIYKIATEELGMVYANKDQVRMYNKTESEYVRQYEDIPER